VSEKPEQCIFCRAASRPEEEESLVLFRGKRVFALLNRYPYNNGHVMIAPYAHAAWLSDSDPATRAELIDLVARAERVLVREYHTDGLNVGINFGEAAGAGIADHYHVHVVPRWKGDTNFMTVAGAIRVVPEELPATWKRLSPLFAEPRG
jgi:ATP adenylyltransferase